MKANTAVFVLIMLASVAFAFGQRPTVTNETLEKYRQQRLAAEKDLRENYEKLGFPSPEEREARDKASREKLDEIAANLRDDEIARQRTQAVAGPTVERIVRVGQPQYRPYGLAPAAIWGYSIPRGRRVNGRFYTQTYYVSGGSIWTVGPATRPRPLIQTRRRR